MAVLCAAAGALLSGCDDTQGPALTPSPTLSPTPGPTLSPISSEVLHEIWESRLQAMASQNVSQIILDYQEQPTLLFLREGGGGIWMVTKGSKSGVAEWYGELVTSRQPVLQSYKVDNASRTIFSIWNSGESSDRISAETLRFDSQGKIQYHIGSVNCLGSGANESQAEIEDAAMESDLMGQLYDSWRVGDVDGVLQLHTEASQVLYYNPAEGDEIQTFSGLARIRHFFNLQISGNETLDSRVGAWRTTPAVGNVSEAWFQHWLTSDIDLFMTLIPDEDGASIAHLFVTKASDDSMPRNCVDPLV